MDRIKRSKLFWPLLVLLTVQVLGASAWANEPAPQCNCTFPNSGKYGVIQNGTCVVVDCWIPL